MAKLAIIFPGQGAQYLGMGKDLYEHSQTAKILFKRADDILGMNISSICFQGPEDKLKDTFYQQLAIFLVSSVAWEVIKEKQNPEPAFFAGLSLGEYTAVYACGMLDFEQALLLVKLRAELMEKAAQNNPSTMLAVLGLNKEAIETANLANCYVANLNSPSQVVVSVSKEAKDKVSEELIIKGAKKVIELNVSGGFHSPFMQAASDELKEKIGKVGFKDSKMPVVCNVDAVPYSEGEKVKGNLIAQLTCPVLWQRSVELMRDNQVKSFYEVGPGKVLKGLLRKIDPCLEVKNLGKVDDFNNQLDSALSG